MVYQTKWFPTFLEVGERWRVSMELYKHVPLAHQDSFTEDVLYSMPHPPSPSARLRSLCRGRNVLKHYYTLNTRWNRNTNIVASFQFHIEILLSCMVYCALYSMHSTLYSLIPRLLIFCCKQCATKKKLVMCLHTRCWACTEPVWQCCFSLTFGLVV